MRGAGLRRYNPRCVAGQTAVEASRHSSGARLASYLLLAALMAGLAADVYRIGFTYIDTFRIFEESSRRGC